MNNRRNLLKKIGFAFSAIVLMPNSILKFRASDFEFEGNDANVQLILNRHKDYFMSKQVNQLVYVICDQLNLKNNWLNTERNNQIQKLVQKFNGTYKVEKKDNVNSVAYFTFNNSKTLFNFIENLKTTRDSTDFQLRESLGIVTKFSLRKA